MKVLRSMVVLSVAVTGLSSVSLAIADTVYENDSGQSAQMSHLRQDQRSQTANEGRAARGQADVSVRAFRQRNLLGQSDAMSQTQPYGSLSVVNQVGFDQATPDADQQMGNSTYHSSTYHTDVPNIGNRSDK